MKWGYCLNVIRKTLNAVALVGTLQVELKWEYCMCVFRTLPQLIGTLQVMEISLNVI